MDILIALLFPVISALLVFAPPVAAWRRLSKPVPGWPGSLQVTLALVGPFAAACLVVVLMWLPAYSGQCGGWLGETSEGRGGGKIRAL